MCVIKTHSSFNHSFGNSIATLELLGLFTGRRLKPSFRRFFLLPFLREKRKASLGACELAALQSTAHYRCRADVGSLARLLPAAPLRASPMNARRDRRGDRRRSTRVSFLEDSLSTAAYGCTFLSLELTSEIGNVYARYHIKKNNKITHCSYVIREVVRGKCGCLGK